MDDSKSTASSDDSNSDTQSISSYLSTSSDENVEQSDNLNLYANVIKNYNIICELGRGSFSIVWLAFGICSNKFYALKVQNPSEYSEGLDEIKFVSTLPTEPAIFNNLVEYFIEIKNNKKYLCSVWELHCSNIDGLIRKGEFENGFPLHIVKKIMNQLLLSVKILHKNFKVFHGDIKTDNILIKGLNAKDEFIIRRYKEEKFFDKYTEAKNNYWLSLGKDLKSIDKMKKEKKMEIRIKIHREITEKILDEYYQTDISKYSIDSKYLESMDISLADFGTHCQEHNYYEQSFGTRYYQAPEILLMGKCSYPVDIWALGCTFYELLSGKLLFDPIKDSKHSRDYYHLCLINETCGNFPNNFLKNTKYYKNFFDSRGYLIKYKQPSENRLDRKINELNYNDYTKEQIKEILINTLEIDSKKRWTINDLIAHPFFN